MSGSMLVILGRTPEMMGCTLQNVICAAVTVVVAESGLDY